MNMTGLAGALVLAVVFIAILSKNTFIQKKETLFIDECDEF